ncbi:MAG: PPOX class F420-dependent oxidoreductase [Knoellia sp.]
MAIDPRNLSSDALDFLTERHLATLTTLRADGSPHVVPVGFTWDNKAFVARVITNDVSQKAINAARSGTAVICQVDGRRWLSLEGQARVLDDADSVLDAVTRYAGRYRQPRINPTRVVIEIAVTRVLGNV